MKPSLRIASFYLGLARLCRRVGDWALLRADAAIGPKKVPPPVQSMLDVTQLAVGAYVIMPASELEAVLHATACWTALAPMRRSSEARA